MPEKLIFNNSVIYVVDKMLNFSESVRECRNIGYQLLSKATLSMNKVYDEIRKLENNKNFSKFRILSLNNNTVDCFGLYNVFAQKIKSEYLINICREDFEFNNDYFTLCEKSITENQNNVLKNHTLTIMLVLIICFVLFGVVAPVLFFCRKKIFTRFHNVLVEDDVDRNSNQVGFL